MHSLRQRQLLNLLYPDIDDATMVQAAELLAAVDASLDAVPHSSFDDAFPAPVTFNPMHEGVFVPTPLALDAVVASAGESVRSRGADMMGGPLDVLSARINSSQSEAEALQALIRERLELWQPVLNGFLTVTDLDVRAGASTGVLAGVPIGLQDMIDARGVVTTAGSILLRERVPERDAPAWAALREAGAVLAGKLNTQEFAAGTNGENDWFGPMRNPWDPTRTAGGAAGGAGAAVAAGIVPAALATDPGGSIRVPAAFCGVTGFKPTYGAIDRRGTVPLTWTTETLGILASGVANTALLADHLLDGRAQGRWGSGCVGAARRGAAASRLNLTVGVPRNWISMGLEPAVQTGFNEVLGILRDLGVRIVDVTLPDHDSIAPIHRAIAFSEAAAIHEHTINVHSDSYGEQIRARQQAGRAMLAVDYLHASKIRDQMVRSASAVWRDVDLVVVPTVPVVAKPIGTRTVSTGTRGGEAAHTVYTRYAAPLSTLGWPALSIPAGLSPEGLPVGVQFTGPPHSEPLVFLVAASTEARTEDLPRPHLDAATGRTTTT